VKLFKKKDTPHKTKLDYLKSFANRIKRGDKNTPTLAQYSKMSGAQKSLAKAGVNWNKDKPSARLRRKKK